jgi:hypothetical protein
MTDKHDERPADEAERDDDHGEDQAEREVRRSPRDRQIKHPRRDR